MDAVELHRDALVVDLHADTFEMVGAVGYDLRAEHRSWAMAGHLLGHVDLPRLQRGGVTAQVFGLVSAPWGGRNALVGKLRRRGALIEAAAEGGELIRARGAEDVRRAEREGRVAALIGVEGSHGLVADGLEPFLDEAERQGVVYHGPAHLFDSGCAPSHIWHRGGARCALTEAGEALVEGLRRRSILLDLAHMPREPFFELCRAATGPLIVSHTGLAGVAPHWRNTDDEQVRAVAALGGVIGVIMTPRYLGRPGAAGVADHLEHLVAVGGEDVAALGSDFDGLVRPPRDMVDAAGLPRITEELVSRGMAERVIRKILGENALRLL